MLFLVLLQHPATSQPVGQYSKGHAPPCQSPAVTEPHTHLVIIMTPPVPSVLNNLAGVSLATASPAALDHLLSTNTSYRLHSHCLWGFLIGLDYWLHEDAVTPSCGVEVKDCCWSWDLLGLILKIMDMFWVSLWLAIKRKMEKLDGVRPIRRLYLFVRSRESTLPSCKRNFVVTN